ncbi:lipid IV(A) 3-deoxy-D-manno-octulosonic acid transferase [Alcanivorax sp. JB21]|nr:lipid IV(A) 3-deoxy-D-manno-octulosonic acid transferase [Alcanivorax limicola]
MRLVYSLLWYLLLPALLLRLWWRGRREPAYRVRWQERLALGLGRHACQNSIWVHAVSVGETLAAEALIEALLRQYPDLPVVLTTTSHTASRQVQQRFADRVIHVYCPWDTPDALHRFFNTFQPRLILLMETELWPNMIALASLRAVPVMLVNGRLSARTFNGYQRVPALTAPMLAGVSRLLVQSDVDARRFLSLGAAAAAIEITGSIKFDTNLQAVRPVAARIRADWTARPVWIAASTHRGEDEQVLAAHHQICQSCPDALLILVPRHPERFARMAALVTETGFRMARRSAGERVTAQTQVYLGDTMGELLALFGACDVAFVGGSLVPAGGHNLLEPAAWGVPVVTGPHLENFERIAALLAEAGALSSVGDAHSLAEVVTGLLGDAALRQRQGAAAAAVVAANTGALAQTLAAVSDQLLLSGFSSRTRSSST